jgi:hypothetical protein
MIKWTGCEGKMIEGHIPGFNQRSKKRSQYRSLKYWPSSLILWSSSVPSHVSSCTIGIQPVRLFETSEVSKVDNGIERKSLKSKRSSRISHEILIWELEQWNPWRLNFDAECHKCALWPIARNVGNVIQRYRMKKSRWRSSKDDQWGLGDWVTLSNAIWEISKLNSHKKLPLIKNM